MSEPIPESIPTSADPRSRRAVKKRALTPVSQQSANIEALFAHPDRNVEVAYGPKAKTLAPPPDIVANVQGSSAGAGSGEFHVYKASRRREYERLKMMDEEAKKEQDDKEFQERREEMRKKDEAKTSKNQKRRERQKNARKFKKEGAEGGRMEGVEGENEAKRVKRMGPRPDASAGGLAEDDQNGAVDGNAEIKAVDEMGITFHDED
ncbi:MAG: hypothetical protein M1820_005988 [Bogoriella megaspora]|nr:MAG: hypothetical protein M1820_005988 [Bogoriella megaspora]